MSELRYNQISRDWVIIASDRAKRPTDFKKAKEKEVLPKWKEDCPFCPGNEQTSGADTFRIGDGKKWKTRVVYNKFPALSDKTKEKRKAAGPYKWISGYGVHEVIVEHPDHNTAIPIMNYDEVEDIIKTYKNRYVTIGREEGIRAITVFKNHGPQAGCSLTHPHSQLIATPIVPPNIRMRVENTVEYFDITGKCILCNTLEHELKEKVRIVLETDKFVSFIPYAAASPFLVWVLPRKHKPSFDEIDETEIKDLARNLKDVLAKLYHGLDNPDFNYTIRSVPVKEKGNDAFHWHITIVPRLTQPAGFELGSGIFINASIPEESAEFLRNVKC